MVAFDLAPTDRVFQFASYTFDASVSEIFIALTSGAALHVGRRDVVLSPDNLARVLARERITNITLPPTLLRLLDPAALPLLRTVISAGDACTPDIVEKWAQDRRLVNAYGPTETTIGPTYNVVSDLRTGASSGTGAPIGRAIPNVRTYILDRNGQPQPLGVPGEAAHRRRRPGARGYVGRPDLTAEKFVPCPWIRRRKRRPGEDRHDPSPALPGSSGAVCVWFRRDASIGRATWRGGCPTVGSTLSVEPTTRSKIRGFRVELGEIEAILSKAPGIKQAVVLAQPAHGDGASGAQNGGGERRRQARGMRGRRRPSTGPSEGEVRGFLRSQLPDYMMPAAFVSPWTACL